MSDNENRSLPTGKVFYPFLFALMLVIGIGIGWMLQPAGTGKVAVFSKTQYDRLDEILNYIDNRYVDTVDTDHLFAKAVDEMFASLDPHSLYIPGEELARLNEPLRGQFEGIGIEFYILQDTITVVATLSGGPSEEVGILPGDKIIAIEDTTVAGVNIQNQDVIRQLKGPKGSKVKVTIDRSNAANPLDFVITRDAVRLASVDVAYMVDTETGYLKMSKFAASTHKDMVAAIEDLKGKGMSRLILDLRDNGGGYLDQATRIADEFLDGNKKIVYTEGRMYPEKVYRAGNPGVYEDGPMVVLINESSASASEILAGALQDWGRATIVGRRSFGKALVQEEIRLNDGSAMRLTVARYYTPKGRSIQRSYDEGIAAYNEDHWNRMVSEYGATDTFALHDTAAYGIAPDVYIPWDTSVAYRSVISLINRGYIPRFTYHYFANHQADFLVYESVEDYLTGFEVTNKMLDDFMTSLSADSTSYALDASEIAELIKYEAAIKTVLKAYFGRQLFYYDAFYPIMNKLDNELKAVLRMQRNG